MYRWATFTHWLNLTSLAIGGTLAAASGSVGLALLLAATEATALWILPDLPAFRRLVDGQRLVQQVDRERRFYVAKLFAVGGGGKRLLVEDERPTWRRSAAGINGALYKTFVELVEIVDRLRELAAVRHAAVSGARLDQAERAVNGWLRLQYAIQARQQAVNRIKEDVLWQEVDTLKEQIGQAPPVRAGVLKERLRLILYKLRTLPKALANLELCQAKAENIVYALQQMGDAAAASQGADVDLLADGLVDQYGFLEQDLAELSAMNDTRELVEGIDWAEEMKPADKRQPKAVNGGPTADKVLQGPAAEDLAALETELRMAYVQRRGDRA